MATDERSRLAPSESLQALPTELLSEVGLHLLLPDLLHFVLACRHIHQSVFTHPHFRREQALRRHYQSFGLHLVRGDNRVWKDLTHYINSISFRGDDRLQYVSELHLSHLLDHSCPNNLWPHSSIPQDLESILSDPEIGSTRSPFNTLYRAQCGVQGLFSILVPCFRCLHTVVFPYTRTNFVPSWMIDDVLDTVTSLSTDVCPEVAAGHRKGPNLHLHNLRVLDWSNTARAPLSSMCHFMLLPTVRILRASHASLRPDADPDSYKSFMTPRPGRASDITRIDLFETYLTDAEISHFVHEMLHGPCIINICNTSREGHHEYKLLSIVSVGKRGEPDRCVLSRHYLKRRELGMRPIAHHKTYMPQPVTSHEEVTGRTLEWDTDERRAWSKKYQKLDEGPWDEEEPSWWVSEKVEKDNEPL